MFSVYILYSITVDRYFVGFTSNLDSQLARHNSGRNKNTKSGIPWKLVYRESFDDRTESVEREKEIKSVTSRDELINEIQSVMNELN